MGATLVLIVFLANNTAENVNQKELQSSKVALSNETKDKTQILWLYILLLFPIQCKIYLNREYFISHKLVKVSGRK